MTYQTTIIIDDATSFQTNEQRPRRRSSSTFVTIILFLHFLTQVVHCWGPSLYSVASNLHKRRSITTASANTIQFHTKPSQESTNGKSGDHSIFLENDNDDNDPLFWTSFMEKPIKVLPCSSDVPFLNIVPSSRSMTRIKLQQQDNNVLTDNDKRHKRPEPTMVLREEKTFPIQSASVPSPLARLPQALSSSSMRKTGLSERQNLHDRFQQQRRGILGFDVFEIQSKRCDSDESKDRRGRTVRRSTGSQYQINNHNRRNEINMDKRSSFFPAPGLKWKDSPITSYANTNKPTAASMERLLQHSSSSSPTPLPLPVWFPWNPTKEQITALKLEELKEACSERGLSQAGNRNELREKMFKWKNEQQIQHQIRINKAHSSKNWFRDTTSYNITRLSIYDNDHKNVRHCRTGTISSEKRKVTNVTSCKIPNSLEEWSRSVDTGKLTRKRQDIIRQQRFGRRPNKRGFNSDNNDNNGNQAVDIKEYLLKLNNLMKDSSSSSTPRTSNNKEVKELYDASKKADQLGEPMFAIKLLESLLEVTPNDARIYRRLSRIHNELGNVDIARMILQEGLRKLPKNPWLWHGLGQLELSHGRTQFGIKCYKRAIQEDPTFAHSYHAWGVHEFSNGEIVKAMKILKSGIKYCPTNHRLHHALGDIYRGAKLLQYAEQSYCRALAEGPSVSNSFAYSALASLAYDKGEVEDARRWLCRSIETNDGRHAQGWLALAELEEAEGNIELAIKICEASIIQYEKGLVKTQQRHKRGRTRQDDKQRKNITHLTDHSKRDSWNEKIFKVSTKSRVTRHNNFHKYRSGDKFFRVFRHWARLEGRYGTAKRTNQVYYRAASMFPMDYKISLDWARYHSEVSRNDRVTRILFEEACSRAADKHADPYREYASFEMSRGRYERGRQILFRGFQAVRPYSHASRNEKGLTQLYTTWAACEWHLRNIQRVVLLIDHALQSAEDGDNKSELRSIIFFFLALFQHHECNELYLAQHFIGLCLQENSLPGGNGPVWKFWGEIANRLGNTRLERECLKQFAQSQRKIIHGTDGDLPLALNLIDTLKGTEKLKKLIRQEPWYDKLQTLRAFKGQQPESPLFYFFHNMLQNIPIDEEESMPKEHIRKEAHVFCSETSKLTNDNNLGSWRRK